MKARSPVTRTLAFAALTLFAILLFAAIDARADSLAAAQPGDAAAIPSAQVDSPTLLDDVERDAFDAINRERAANGLGALVVTPILSNAAEWLVHDLVNQNQISHTDSSGRSLRDRLDAFGYPSNVGIAENVARGFDTGAEVVAGFIASPLHYANLLRNDGQAIGIARAEGGAPYGWYWTVVIGSTLDSGVPSQAVRIVPLQQGWNLVSWLGPTLSAELAIDTLTPIVDGIWRWDAGAQSWSTLGGIAAPDTILPASEAVWIHVIRGGPAYWPQLISTTAAQSIDLLAGWAMVTWTGADGVSLEDATASLGASLVAVAKYDAVAQQFLFHRPNLDLINELLVLNHGDAVWVLTDASAVWEQAAP